MAFYAWSVLLYFPLYCELGKICTPSNFRQLLKKKIWLSSSGIISSENTKRIHFSSNKNVKECFEKLNVLLVPEDPLLAHFPSMVTMHLCLPTGRSGVMFHILNYSSESDPATIYHLFHSGVHYINTEEAQRFLDFLMPDQKNSQVGPLCPKYGTW